MGEYIYERHADFIFSDSMHVGNWTYFIKILQWYRSTINLFLATWNT